NMKGLLKDMIRLWKFLSEILLSIYYYRNIRVALNNHITRGIKYVHSRNTLFPHPVGIVIGQKVEIGVNCTIYQNVTIGTKDTDNYQGGKYPVLGDNVKIFPNSIIRGDVKIGSGAIIGAGSIVLNDLGENT